MKIPIQQLLISLALPLAACAQFQPHPMPASIGLVNVIPSDQSPETDDNSEPSLGVFTGGQRAKVIVHTFSPSRWSQWPYGDNLYYTSDNGGALWITNGTFTDSGCTLDWSRGGTAYAAIRESYLHDVHLFKSSDPTSYPAGNNFSGIPADAFVFNNEVLVFKPWLRVATVANKLGSVDHLYIGIGGSGFSGDPAMIVYSLDDGMNWTETFLESKLGASDDSFAGVRLAISGAGDRVYAVFQRLTPGAELVLVRDDNSGSKGFHALNNETRVAIGSAPWGTPLGLNQHVAGGFDVAVNPGDENDVYVAYTEVLNSVPWLRVKHSTDGGVTFSPNPSFSQENASMPALAVTRDGTVGLLFTTKRGPNLEVHFFKAYDGNFTVVTGPRVYDPWNRYSVDRVLASFPDSITGDRSLAFLISSPPLGDYFTLKAFNNTFYGTFSAPGEPEPSHFPCGVFLQRGVKVNGSVQYNSWLTSPGTLVDFSDKPVASSIDPYFFSEASALRQLAILPSSSGSLSLAWPVLPPSYPQFQLESSPLLGPSSTWMPATNGVIVETNGNYVMTLEPTEDQQYFRLRQDVASGQFQLFTSAGKGGTLNPSGTNGILIKAGTDSQVFTATPDDNYAIGKWYIDGVLMQSGKPSLSVSNINADHTVLVTFVASNDLAVTTGAFSSSPEQPLLIGSNFNYVVQIANVDLNLLTGIAMTDVLPDTVSFVSATTSQGSVVNNGGIIEGDFGSLNPGASITVTITVTPEAEGILTNTVDAWCNESEPDLANNTVTQLTGVLAPAPKP